MRQVVWPFVLAFFAFSGTSASAADADPWQDFRFLVGHWSGEGKGAPGKGKGVFSFAFDLQGKILVRKHKAVIAATGDRPESTHEDLMVIYPETGGQHMRAMYFDNARMQ